MDMGVFIVNWGVSVLRVHTLVCTAARAPESKLHTVPERERQCQDFPGTVSAWKIGARIFQTPSVPVPVGSRIFQGSESKKFQAPSVPGLSVPGFFGHRLRRCLESVIFNKRTSLYWL
jgi:hypothetical protein